MNTPKKLSIFFLIIICVGLGYFIFGKAAVSASTVSGTVHFDRLKPDPADKGSLYIMQRLYQSEAPFQETGVVATLKDDSPWIWDKAEKGKTYEIKAQLRIDGKVIKDSDSIVASIPTEDQVATMTITWDDLPDYVVKEQTVIMGGTVQINGLIPEDSILNVQTKTEDDAEYITQWTSENVTETNTWTWKSAVPKTKYEMKAVLLYANENIGESSVLKESGIKTNEIEFLINSKAKQVSPIQPTVTPLQNTPTPLPNTTSTIKGYFTLNGPLEANSSVLIMWSVPGKNNWQEIKRVKNLVNGSQIWEWNGAQSGVSYEVGISLQVNEKTTATSQNKIVTAPANDVNYILNTGVNVPVPSNRPILQSCTNNVNNQWDANITIPLDDRYGNYWMQIGSTMGGGELYSSKMRPPSNDNMIRVTVKVNNNQTYYARHAYSFCSNCSSDINFSNFSDSLIVLCGASPQPTATPLPPAPTQVPPTPTVPPNTSRCNETCGSNGYSCVLGLDCLSTDVPGQSACRNPNCTDRTNCNCL